MLPFDIDTFIRLREEAVKSWQYGISNEVMKCFNYRNLKTGRYDIASEDEIKFCLRGRWWEILLRCRNGDFYCCIIEPVLTHTSLHLKFGKTRIQRNRSMFVTIGQAVQNPKSVVFASFPLKCIVRLKRLNDLSGIIGDICHESLQFFGTVPLCTTQEYGKFNISLPSPSSRTGILVKSSQLPSEIVKKGTQVMENVTRNNTKEDRNGGNINPEDVGCFVRIEILGTKAERFSVVPTVDGILEGLYVFRRPIELSPWPIEWVYMLYSYKTTNYQYHNL